MTVLAPGDAAAVAPGSPAAGAPAPARTSSATPGASRLIQATGRSCEMAASAWPKPARVGPSK